MGPHSPFVSAASACICFRCAWVAKQAVAVQLQGSTTLAFRLCVPRPDHLARARPSSNCPCPCGRASFVRGPVMRIAATCCHPTAWSWVRCVLWWPRHPCPCLCPTVLPTSSFLFSYMPYTSPFSGVCVVIGSNDGHCSKVGNVCEASSLNGKPAWKACLTLGIKAEHPSFVELCFWCGTKLSPASISTMHRHVPTSPAWDHCAGDVSSATHDAHSLACHATSRKSPHKCLWLVSAPEEGDRGGHHKQLQCELIGCTLILVERRSCAMSIPKKLRGNARDTS